MPLPTHAPGQATQRKLPPPQLYPLPPAAEVRRSPAYLAAMRWMVYGPGEVHERTADAAAARFGLDGGVSGAHGFRSACADDGITDWQLIQQGWTVAREEVRAAAGVTGGIDPPASLIPPPSAPPQPMGSSSWADRERRERESQRGMLEAQRLAVISALATTSPKDGAHAKLIGTLNRINSMLAEASGLALVQGAARGRAGRASSDLTAPAPAAAEGRLIDVTPRATSQATSQATRR